jgi:hypothetical protein
MSITTKPKMRPRLSIKVRLCGNHCRACQGRHEMSQPMDAERIDRRRVRVLTDPVFANSILTDADYVVAREP